MTTKILPRNSPGVNTYARVQNGKLQVEVQVNDETLRQKGVKTDGYEKAFALVPTRDGKWKRVDLDYQYSFGNRGGGAPADTHSKTLDLKDVSLDALREQGVAFGLEVSDKGQNTTVWLQYRDDNQKIDF